MRRASPALALSVLLCLAGCAPEGPSAFVTFNVVPDSECIASAEGSTTNFYPIGLYDVAPGAIPRDSDSPATNNCNAPYVLNLLVNSFLRPGGDQMLGRAEPNILQIDSAEVHLKLLDGRPLTFDREDQDGDGVADTLPNPFLVVTNNTLAPSTGNQPSRGIAAVEAIPAVYAAQLDVLGEMNTQILAEIQIFGTTTGDVDIEFKPFKYPIELCYGCLQICLTEIPEGTTEEDLRMDECPDNSGADGRICIDRGC